MNSGAHFGYIDESLARRGDDRQDYLVCAAVVAEEEREPVRESLRPLLRRGQIKLHWSDESAESRERIIEHLASLSTVSLVVSHASQPQKSTERFRRKCLERLYYEMAGMGVDDLMLECRTPAQDRRDVEHIVGLRNQGLRRSMCINHCRGGDEPLLWIADAVLGAINAAHRGQSHYLATIESTILLQAFTADSLQTSERP